MSYYYHFGEGEVVGPCPLQEITALAAIGTIPQETQVCREGEDSWRPLADLIPVNAENLTPAKPADLPLRRNQSPAVLFLAIFGAVVLGGGVLMFGYFRFISQKPAPVAAAPKLSPTPQASLPTPTPYVEAPDYKNFLRVARRLITATSTGINFPDFHGRAVEVISAAEEAVRVAPSDDKRKAVAVFAIAVADVDDIWRYKIAHQQMALDYDRSRTSRSGEHFPCSDRWDNHLSEMIVTYHLDTGSWNERASSHLDELPHIVFIDSAIQKIFGMLSRTFSTLESTESEDIR